MTLDIKKIRADFPILSRKVNGESLIYFDNGATAQKPQAVISAVEHYYQHENSNIHRGIHTLSQEATDAYEKAKAADKILRKRLKNLGLEFDLILTEYVGVNATHGHLSGEPPKDIPEVQLRIGVRGQSKEDVARFTKEIAPLILTGPPAVTGFAGGRPKVEEIIAYFPALIPKELITTKVEILEA